MKLVSLKFLFIALMGITVISCSEEDQGTVPEFTTILELAEGNPDLSILVDAVNRAGLSSALSSGTNRTVFAPNNAAFSSLLTELGASSLDDIDQATLTAVLTYHVINAELPSSQVSTGYVKTLSNGPEGNPMDLYVNTDSGVRLNDRSSVIQADVEADNGVVHVIDRVLLPPTVVDIAIANNTFSTLVNAVVTAGLADALSAQGPFTVFAPTDEAFGNLLTALGISSLAEVPVDLLTSILKYHVVPGNVTSSMLSNTEVGTLEEGTNIGINIDNGVVLNGSVNVITADVQGSNGIIHVIDQVLTIPEPSNTIVDIAAGNPDFSILVDAVVKAGLAETLSSAGTFTVFAPTNDAFNALFSELNITGLDALDAETVKNIVLYHALGDVAMSAGLTNTYVTTLNTDSPDGMGVSMSINVDNGVTLNGDVRVVSPDIMADNGVVHVIDKVLMPINIVDAAIDNPIFSTLVEAVVEANLVGTLATGGPFTVFAPTNDAFAELLDILQVSSVQEIDPTVLSSTLLYHVIGDNVMSSELSDGDVPTLNDNNTVKVSLGDEVKLNDEITVILTDVQTTNGIIHVIDKVLLPSN